MLRNGRRLVSFMQNLHYTSSQTACLKNERAKRKYLIGIARFLDHCSRLVSTRTWQNRRPYSSCRACHLRGQPSYWIVCRLNHLQRKLMNHYYILEYRLEGHMRENSLFARNKRTIILYYRGYAIVTRWREERNNKQEAWSIPYTPCRSIQYFMWQVVLVKWKSDTRRLVWLSYS